MASIIVEGPDNSGKTTLVRQIASTFGLPTVVSCFDSRNKYGKRMAQVHKNIHQLLLNSSLGSPTTVKLVLDRCPVISEEVYGPLLRGSNDIEEATGKTFLEQVKQMVELAPLIIFCRPSLDSMLDFGEREQMAGVIDNAKTLIDRYDEVFKHIPNHLHYNWQDSNAQEKFWLDLAEKMKG